MSRQSSPQVAVIGCGYWGKNLVRNFAQLGSLSMVCDATLNGQDTARQIAPQATIVADIQEALVPKAEFPQSGVQGVVIATPAETHFDLTAQALEAGKDVMVEKPLALTYEQGSRLVRLASERERILMVGHVLEYHPAVVRLVELVQAGELGKVHYIYSNRLSLGKVRREENILRSFAA